MNEQTSNENLSAYAKSFGLALVIAGIENSILVVIKEKSPAVNAAMQKMTGHHWITHVAIVLLTFVILGLLLSRMNSRRGPNFSTAGLIACVGIGTAAASAIIFGFYLMGD